MANSPESRKKAKAGFGIVLRFSLLVSFSVLATAVVVYFGMEYRLSSLYRFERRNRVNFLVDTIVHGTINLIASPAAAGGIPRVVNETISRAFSQGEPIVFCRITDRDNGEVFRFEDKNFPRRADRTCVRKKILSGDEKLGEIELCEAERAVFEAERMRQVLTIGNTLSAIIRTYLLRNDYFQIEDLIRKFTREDPNILYCAVLNETGETIYSYNLDKYAGKIPAEPRPAELLSRGTPAFILETKGGIIDATHLIEYRGQTLGAVRIGYSLASLRASVIGKRRQLFALILALTFAALALSVLAARGVAGPVKKLGEAVASAAGRAPERDIDFEAAEREMEAIIAAYNAAAVKTRDRSDELGSLANSFGDLLGTLLSRLRDLSRFHRRMCQADRLSSLGALSAGIAHEINNPLTIISTYVQLMSRREGLDAETKEEVEIISQEIRRIAGKVKELMSFAQEKPPETVSTGANGFLGETTRLVRHELKKNNIQLVEKYDAPPAARVSIDHNQMRQVFLNIFLNAVHAMKGGGTLTVETRLIPSGAHIEIRVSDTGPGIPPEVLPRIFDPFFTTKSLEEGTGLGLAIAYRIIESHGGEIVAGNAPGGGASFVIRLPVEKTVESR